MTRIVICSERFEEFRKSLQRGRTPCQVACICRFAADFVHRTNTEQRVGCTLPNAFDLALAAVRAEFELSHTDICQVMRFLLTQLEQPYLDEFSVWLNQQLADRMIIDINHLIESSPCPS